MLVPAALLPGDSQQQVGGQAIDGGSAVQERHDLAANPGVHEDQRGEKVTQGDPLEDAGHADVAQVEPGQAREILLQDVIEEQAQKEKQERPPDDAPIQGRRRLADRTLELVDIPSVSGEEQAILEHVGGVLAGVGGQVHADADGLLHLLPRQGRPLVLLTGHLDTVPAQGNLPGRREGDAVTGLGASDMKGACAVMIELALWAAAERPRLAVDLGFLFFTREELPADRSALRPLLARLPVLREVDLAVVMEPTDNALQVGCLGNLTAEVSFTGRSAHSARPWFGVNALHAAVAGLAEVAGLPPRPAVIQGLEFREVVSVVRIEGGIADNVVPDLATCRLNYRYAPDRDPAAAEARLRELVPVGEMRVVANSPPAPVVADHPLCARLRAAGGLDLQPKQAWTNVADFAAHGVAAVNFGPGSTAHAHRADERVEVESLVRSFDTLRRFVCEEAQEGRERRETREETR